jgi:glycosyltransferase involved in cell wall biosynthesis
MPKLDAPIWSPESRVAVVMPTGRLLGGAERALVAALQDEAFREHVSKVIFLEAGDLAALVADMGVPTELLPFGRTRDLIGVARSTGRLARTLRADRNTVVLSWMTKAAIVAAPAARLAGARHVIYQHGPTSRRGIDRLAARLPADAILCCSDWAAESARRAWPDRPVRTVYPPLPEATFHAPDQAQARRELGLDPHATIVVMVSRWQAWKRVHLALEACDSTEWPADAQLVLVGGPVPTEPDYSRLVEDRLRAIRTSNRALSVGFHPAGATWMAAADIVLHLSDDEPFGLVLVEAAAVSTPMVTTASGGAAELAVQLDNCAVTQPTPSAVARAVKAALSNSRHSHRPSSKALEARFGPSSWWRQLVQQSSTH